MIEYTRTVSNSDTRCVCCDELVPNGLIVRAWGHVVSHKNVTHESPFDKYVLVEYFICDNCHKLVYSR